MVARGGMRDRSAVYGAGALALSRASGSPHAPANYPANEDQLALGRALAARISDVTRLTAEAAAATGLSELGSRRFAKPIHDVHTLATRVIARFLITGQGTSNRERSFIAGFGVLAALYRLPVATLATSFLLWRDANLRVLNEEVNVSAPPWRSQRRHGG